MDFYFFKPRRGFSTKDYLYLHYKDILKDSKQFNSAY